MTGKRSESAAVGILQFQRGAISAFINHLGHAQIAAVAHLDLYLLQRPGDEIAVPGASL